MLKLLLSTLFIVDTTYIDSGKSKKIKWLFQVGTHQ